MVHPTNQTIHNTLLTGHNRRKHETYRKIPAMTDRYPSWFRYQRWFRSKVVTRRGRSCHLNQLFLRFGPRPRVAVGLAPNGVAKRGEKCAPLAQVVPRDLVDKEEELFFIFFVIHFFRFRRRKKLRFWGMLLCIKGSIEQWVRPS